MVGYVGRHYIGSVYVTYVSYPIPWKSIFFLEAMDPEDDLMRDCVKKLHA